MTTQRSWSPLMMACSVLTTVGKPLPLSSHCTASITLSRDGGGKEVGSCMKDFRNKPNPVKIRVLYLRGALEVGHVMVM